MNARRSWVDLLQVSSVQFVRCERALIDDPARGSGVRAHGRPQPVRGSGKSGPPKIWTDPQLFT